MKLDRSINRGAVTVVYTLPCTAPSRFWRGVDRGKINKVDMVIRASLKKDYSGMQVGTCSLGARVPACFSYFPRRCQ